MASWMPLARGCRPPRPCANSVRDRGLDAREVLADLDRLEQDEDAPLAENAEPEFRLARQVATNWKPILDEVEPADRLAPAREIARVHAAGNVDDRDDIVGRPLQLKRGMARPPAREPRQARAARAADREGGRGSWLTLRHAGQIGP